MTAVILQFQNVLLLSQIITQLHMFFLFAALLFSFSAAIARKSYSHSLNRVNFQSARPLYQHSFNHPLN